MELYSINEKLQELDKQALIDLKDIFKEIDENEFKNTEKVLKAFQDCSIDTSCFYEVCGYGNSDYGRDKLEELYAKLFQAEDAIVRPQIMSGTHALYVSLSGLLKYGDTMLSITGLPYDTLQSIIGITGNSNNSLIKCGILYEQIDLINDTFDTNKIIERVKQGGIKLIEIQKSTGYSMRKSLSVKEIKNIIAEIRKIDKEVIIMVDNCYGEFVEEFEPISVGADIMISSLMKNLGAGIATSGGYVVGKKEYIHYIAERLTAPTLGKEEGANFNQLITYYKGLFFAPSVVASALKTQIYASYMLEKLGYIASPKWNEKRCDIIERITFNDKDKLIKFCQGIQKGGPIESNITPMPSPMAGYDRNIIMAGATFTPGATIELSCDGPVVEPFTAYMQGGLTFPFGRLGILIALNNMIGE